MKISSLRLIRVILALLCVAGWTDTASAGAMPSDPLFVENTVRYIVGSRPVCVRSADLDRDGDVDLMVANSGSGDISVLLNCGGGSFQEQQTYRVGERPISISTADFDGDGDVDIAVLNQRGKSISVLLNDGDGTFPQQQVYDVEDIRSFCTGDFDGDGDVDLAAANGAGIVILENIGNGLFSPGATLEVGPHTFFVGCTDLDGDGDIDLLSISTTLGGNVASILYNRGDGLFYEGPSLSGPFEKAFLMADVDGNGSVDLVMLKRTQGLSVFLNEGEGIFVQRWDFLDSSFSAASAHVADLDGDGAVDIVTGNYKPDRSISIFLNHGDGSFSDPWDYKGGSYVGGGDLDGDGDIDLVAADENIGLISMWLNTTEVGTLPEKPGPGPPFWRIAEYAVGDGPRYVRTADLDNDGDLDIVVANHGGENVSVLLNRGDGTFSEQRTYGVGNGPACIYTADFDGDGDIDLAVARGDDDVTILMNRGDGSFSIHNTYAFGYGGFYLRYGGANNLWGADLDSDGDIDLAIVYTMAIVILMNDGSGGFTKGTIIGALDTKYVTSYGDTVRLAGLSSIWGADLDGDGDTDLVVGNSWSERLAGDVWSWTLGGGEVVVFLNNGDASFAEGAVYYPKIWEYTTLVYGDDFDGDGDVDLMAGNAQDDAIFLTLFNDGEGSFSEGTVYNASPLSVYSADLDDDGDRDLVIGGAYPPESILLFFNNEDGTFSERVVYSLASSSRYPAFAVLGEDMDGDGDVDMVVTNSGDDKVVIFYNSLREGSTMVETEEADRGDGVPRHHPLHQNRPNPFNLRTAIPFDLSSPEEVMLSIYNLRGQRVRTLVSDVMEAGRHAVVWDGRDGEGREVASGIYFYKLKAGTFSQTKRMLLLR